VKIYVECSCGKRLEAVTLPVFEEWLADHEEHWIRIAIDHPEDEKVVTAAA
jgi:hypothetical protein